MSRSTISTFKLFELPLGYRLRSDGTVWRKHEGTWIQLALPRDSEGYAILHIRAPLARWVCWAFHGEPDGKKTVRHLDGNRRNDASTNLAWGTMQEQANDRARHGRTAHGERHGRAKLTDQQVAEIRASKGNETAQSAAHRLGVSKVLIDKIRSGSRRAGKRITYAELTQ